MSSDDDKSVHLSGDSDNDDKVLEPTMQRRETEDDSLSDELNDRKKPKNDGTSDGPKPKSPKNRKYSDTIDINSTPRSNKGDKNSTTMIVNGSRPDDSDSDSIDSSRYQDTEAEPPLTHPQQNSKPPPAPKTTQQNTNTTQPVVGQPPAQQPPKSKGCILL
ncbi:hypothetical protein TVAG_210040 [Trichomonas vaginalis G3]|uniref:Uncharacterized protein n=1 Tax=Trichomonas vaginalis (strain ATCC PRA-98 / G3) TaxID=412133 RepID=A2DVR1_TRIV3|nr:hypothetical protein TVAGG3_0734490 [Trichomonas vaginalis G3]EAY15474.1 hypothetical protein TVAG_210040 [Trichomonas vaginalis G3]KAI5511484.1 hypothetical protein TVAGG3_0734490 [Trichomonas vaginalis G3]|eukprot:XP_001327697.1 hypothetical protein [Trichomonas vaginalis G3]